MLLFKYSHISNKSLAPLQLAFMASPSHIFSNKKACRIQLPAFQLASVDSRPVADQIQPGLTEVPRIAQPATFIFGWRLPSSLKEWRLPLSVVERAHHYYFRHFYKFQEHECSSYQPNHLESHARDAQNYLQFYINLHSCIPALKIFLFDEATVNLWLNCFNM